MNTQTFCQPCQAGELIHWLTTDGGFKREGDQPWFRKGMVRVVIEDPEGSYAVHVFDWRDPRAMMLSWSARYTSAPLDVLANAITWAYDSYRASMTPES